MSINTCAFETALGYMAFARRGETVLALSFGHATEEAALLSLSERIPTSGTGVRAVAGTGADGDELVERLQHFARGEQVDFDDVSLDFAGRTLFQRKVLQACRAIPWGNTCTYGELAETAGFPGAARAVGSVMAQNRVPLIVPCHRVLSVCGLGGYSAPQGISMKQRLLSLESGIIGVLAQPGRDSLEPSARREVTVGSS